MNRGRNILLRIIIMTLVFAMTVEVASAAPLTAKDEFTLTVVNDSKEDVTLELKPLEGQKEVAITVRAEDTKKREITEGKYEYYYSSCGSTWDGILKVNKDVKFVIYDCAHMPTKMQINSHLSEDVEVELSGDKNYDFDIELGKNRVELLSGTYIFSWSACDTVFSEELRVEKSGTSEITLHSCEWYESPARIYGKPNPVKFVVANTSTFPVDIYMKGPYTYFFNIQPGTTRFIVASGTYEYGYFLDGTWNTGLVSVLKNGTSTLILKPSYIFGIE